MLMVREMEALRSVNASGIRSADKRISSTAASDGVKGTSQKQPTITSLYFQVCVCDGHRDCPEY